MTDSSAPLSLSVRLRLWVMMFLQYTAWGAWFPFMADFISKRTVKEGTGIFTGGFTGDAYGTVAIAGMIAPFFVGMIADRFFSSERLLVVLHLAGAGLLYFLSTVENQTTFYVTLLAYFLCFVPTLALTNSLSMHHLPDPGRQFPGIRVWGTIGWIVAGQVVGHLLYDAGGYLLKFQSVEFPLGNYGGNGASVIDSNILMKLGAICQLVLAPLCFFLPHTPPSNPGGKVTIGNVLGLDALKLMRRWPFAVFVVGSFLISIPLQFYYTYMSSFLGKGRGLDMPNYGANMTFGQMSEIFFMLLMPLFFVRLGVKYMLLVGMLCWVLRYVLFSYGNMNENVWMLYVGILLHGICYDFFFVTGQIYVDNEADSKIRGAAQGFIAFVTLGLGAYVGAKLSGKTEIYYTVDGVINWHAFWLFPAAIAGVVMVLFALLFHDHPSNQVKKGAPAA